MEEQKKTSKDMIAYLNVTDEIKDILYKIERVASSSNAKVKSAVKDLFLVSPSCKELSKIGKCYERIITTNGVYPVRGARTYLELAFPAEGTSREYAEFFASPLLAAATQEYFTGVFLISFERWGNAKGLIRSEAFEQLTNYIEKYKTHTSFVFHVTPNFEGTDALFKALSNHTNLCRMEHCLPDMNRAKAYVEEQLREAGFEMEKSAKTELDQLIEQKVDMTSDGYRGYQTLEQLVSNIRFELHAFLSDKSGEQDGENYLCVGKSDIQAIAGMVELPDGSIPYSGKLGF